MTRIEKTNAKISQKYAADARANLFRLIDRPKGYSSYRLECNARDAQRQSRLFAAHALSVVSA